MQLKGWLFMANLFNKLSDMAKNAADKTGDMIEIGKLNAKISAEQANICTIKQSIGDYYYERFHTEEYPTEVAELCQQIKLCEEAIASVQADIRTLKEESHTEATGKCPACGAANAPSTKFCGECGGKL